MKFTQEELQNIIKEELDAVVAEKASKRARRKKRTKVKKKKAKKDACYHKVKSRYDVWPSAYASGALSKCRKVGAKNWGNKSEGLNEEEEQASMSELENLALDKFEEEGGAAGEEMMMDFLMDKGASKEEAEKILNKISDTHQDGDLVTPMTEEEILEKKSSRCTRVTKKASSTRKGKKWMKCVKSDSGGYKRIHWGQAGVRVTGKSGNTKRKKSFKKRHNCSKAKSNTPQGQACKDWAE